MNSTRNLTVMFYEFLAAWLVLAVSVLICLLFALLVIFKVFPNDLRFEPRSIYSAPQDSLYRARTIPAENVNKVKTSTYSNRQLSFLELESLPFGKANRNIFPLNAIWSNHRPFPGETFSPDVAKHKLDTTIWNHQQIISRVHNLEAYRYSLSKCIVFGSFDSHTVPMVYFDPLLLVGRLHDLNLAGKSLSLGFGVSRSGLHLRNLQLHAPCLLRDGLQSVSCRPGRFTSGGTTGGISIVHQDRLPPYYHGLYYADNSQCQGKEPRTPVKKQVNSSLILIGQFHHRDAIEFYVVLGILGCYLIFVAFGFYGVVRWEGGHRLTGGLLVACGFVIGLLGAITGASSRLPWEWPGEMKRHHHGKYDHGTSGHLINVSQKHLTPVAFMYYSKYMPNVLPTEKQIAIIGSLCEGSSIRAIERMTGVHRDTVMRLGVRVGQGCTAMMSEALRDLNTTRLEMDEIWGFIGKKEKHVRPTDDPTTGDVWTFCAIDADSKLVPTFKVGKRTNAVAEAFVQDVASRMSNRVQISTDGLKAYVDAIEHSFGGDVDYAQIIKTYGNQEITNNRRYSAPEFVSSEKRPVFGSPDFDLISTSYIERLNATTRLHMRRLTRLTLAFSKKLENFEAAGVTGTQWTVGELLKAVA